MDFDIFSLSEKNSSSRFFMYCETRYRWLPAIKDKSAPCKRTPHLWFLHRWKLETLQRRYHKKLLGILQFFLAMQKVAMPGHFFLYCKIAFFILVYESFLCSYPAKLLHVARQASFASKEILKVWKLYCFKDLKTVLLKQYKMSLSWC